ncbi:MAG: DUF433 domain-containing protein [Anaerolineae bacterium]
MGGRAHSRDACARLLIVNLVANGSSVEEILTDYPYLEAEDIHQSLTYAAWLADETIHPFETAVS